MRPTEILMQEHRVIEQVLDCLEVMAQQCDDGKELDVEAAKEAIDFFRNFADRCHHGKEEDCLFPLLESKGFPREGGPTGVMLHEHEAGRSHVRGMAGAVDAICSGEPVQQTEFVAHARDFIRLLREHINKEDHCLFQMTDQQLSKQDQLQLLESFAHVEHDDLGPGTHQKYLELAAGLVARFGVPSRDSDSSASSSSCGHH